MVLNVFRKYFDPYLAKIAVLLNRLGVRPWYLSILGLILSIASAVAVIILGESGLLLALLLFLSSGLMDALDGQVARLQSSVSAWGAFCDSLIDRLVEIIFVFGLLFSNMLSRNVSYLYITTALLVSYCRSRGESLGVSLKGVGLMERAERILLISLSIVIYIIFHIELNISIMVITVLNGVTILWRIIEVYRGLSREKPF